MIQVAEWVLGVMGVGALIPAGYLGFLALFARRRADLEAAGRGLRFDVVVPAHNEALGIGSTLESLKAMDWPREQVRVVVVAHNCTDATAEVAARHGAEVWVRDEPGEGGKGYALSYAFDRFLAEQRADAVVVIDADTVVDRQLLDAFARRLARGAWALQAHYGVRNPGDTWRTRLMELAFALFHGVRSLARERLNLSAGLRGNGMCFSRSAIEACPYKAHSVVEDVEYGLDLALVGIRIGYVPEAEVLGEMPVDAEGSVSQRRRWEEGRALLKRRYIPKLLARGVTEREPMLLELAMDLLVPPLAQLVLGIGVGLAATAALALVGGRPVVAGVAFGLAGLSVTAYVIRGWALARLGWRGLTALATAPVYAGWKLALVPMRWTRRLQGWTRTTRKGEVR